VQPARAGGAPLGQQRGIEREPGVVWIGTGFDQRTLLGPVPAMVLQFSGSGNSP
jgi:hypothetical protein